MEENRDNTTPPPANDPYANPSPPPAETVTPGGEIPPEPAVLTKEAKQWGMFSHLAALFGFLPILPFPVGNVLGPLILWLIKKDEMAFVNDQGKESLNFQISMSIYALVCLPLVCLAGLGVLLAGIVAIVDLVFIIIASIEANKGNAYRYPLCIRLVK